MAKKDKGQLGVDWVWRLGPEDMCKHRLRRGDRCCLVEWISKTFGDGINPRGPRGAFVTALEDVIRRQIRVPYCPSIAAYNDAPSRPLRESANAFNEAAIAVGFTEEYDA